MLSHSNQLSRKLGVPAMLRSLATSTTRHSFLKDLDLQDVNPGVYYGKWGGSGSVTTTYNPATGEAIGSVRVGTVEDLRKCTDAMKAAKADWASMPMPARGEIVRKIGMELRKHKDALGALISLEMGKIIQEGKGEVQEAIDICDYATGLSRIISGSVIPSERPGHFMMERWNPLKGHVGIVTAFNFPLAVYFWNLAISLVCGNTNIWKGANSTSLVTVAAQKIVAQVLEKEGLSGAVASLCQGPGSSVGDAIIKDPTMELISFTGSTSVGRTVSSTVHSRFGKTILELGGNNAMIVMDDADQSLALRACLFSAVGTAGQRCTSLRRLYLHATIHDDFIDKLRTAYKSIRIGNPLNPETLCGPLHTKGAVKEYTEGIAIAEKQGGKVLVGGKVVAGPGNFVEPTLVSISPDAHCLNDELFAPVLYVCKVSSLEDAIKYNNAVPQGLASSLFTRNQASVFQWTGPLGSDCGIVNVNIGPSGAEIGGAFGGEKETGGGRESGSDSWKQYMRRATCTINHSKALPLAQGIQFD